MINLEALFTITYGLYIVSSGDKNKGNGFISNSVFQVTAKPPKFAICCNKDNFTAGIIHESGVFSVSVLHKDTTSDIFGRFGYKSGKDTDKFEGMSIKYGLTGVPIVLNDSIGFLECKVIQTIDVGTHLMFIGELVQADIVDNTKEPITYQYYRLVKNGVAPKNAPTYIDKSELETKVPTSLAKKYKCSVCGYIYDEEFETTRFANLPDDWVCPLCGAEKIDFNEV